MKIHAERIHSYTVLRSFFLSDEHNIPRVIKAGEKVTTDDLKPLTKQEILDLARDGRLRPELPDLAVYVVRIPFSFPVGDRMVDTKVDERVELRADDALPLLLKSHVRPADAKVWNPERLREPSQRLDRKGINKILDVVSKKPKWEIVPRE